MTQASTVNDGPLCGVRVLELADELGEYCGRVLAGLGADVIKIEPPGGEKTRSYGPFYHDEADPNRSLHFWHYNFGKRGIVLDIDVDGDRAQLRRLAATADVVLESRPPGYLDERDVGYRSLRQSCPSLVFARISPFGDSGPWADYEGSDLIHLALGGVMMNCGYDPDPSGFYETPPIAPQMWQSYHIAGEVTAIQVLAALNYASDEGIGQYLSVSVHDAVSKNTETDLPDWIYARQPHYRQTCRHSFARIGAPAIARTKDGRWLLPYRTYLPGFAKSAEVPLELLQRYGMEFDLADERYADVDALSRPDVDLHVGAVIDRLIRRFVYARDLWKDAQEEGLAWGPLRRPEENLYDEHWARRGTFFDVDYPELGARFTDVGARWAATGLSWRTGPRAPLLGEHTSEVLSEIAVGAQPRKSQRARNRATERPETFISKRGKPFALTGVRIVDLGWLLASGGAGRFFTAHGAEVVKIEHRSRPDAMRMGAGLTPEGGREERERATHPIELSAPASSPNRSGAFMEINAGKRSLSLNLKHARGKELLGKLIEVSDIVIEGFSPGTMERMGFGYERLRELNPGIIYVQQSGMGQLGIYDRLRSYGPTAQAFSGLSEMSGLPEPYPPAGIGYSYLDWFGAYQLALAMMAALYRQRQTGQGCWIDSSQVECGIFLTGTAILDFTVNGRRWERYGNGSPYKLASPHGAYRTHGDDRWIAVAVFTNEQWSNLLRVLDVPQWASDPKLATLSLRLKNDEYLNAMMNSVTIRHDGYELMRALQEAGVPAGVCQTAQDRYECDPQLQHINWLTELAQAEIGVWPVKELPGTFSETPCYIGGALDRHGPSYGEDTEYVLSRILGLSDHEIGDLQAGGVL